MLLVAISVDVWDCLLWQCYMRCVCAVCS